MDEFEGRWKHESAENFDEYLKELGVAYLLRKVVVAACGGIEFRKKVHVNFLRVIKTLTRFADGRWTTTFHSTLKNGSHTFTIGEEREETTPDGRHVKSTVTLENGKLVHTQVPIKAGEKIAVTERWIEDGKLISISKIGNVAARFVDVKV